VISGYAHGFPISTTQRPAGAMVGSGWVAVGSQVNLGVMGKASFLPLLLSPVLAGWIGRVALPEISCPLAAGITKEWCICIGKEQQIVPTPTVVGSALQAVAPTISECWTSKVSANTLRGRLFRHRLPTGNGCGAFP